MVATVDGNLFTEVVVAGNPGSIKRRFGLQGYRPDGSLTEVIAEPDFGFERQRVIVRRRSGGSSTVSVPFAPSPVWTLAPSGAVVSGIGDEYRYEVRYPEDETLFVQREIRRVPVAPGEADYHRRRFRESVSRSGGDDGTIEGDLNSMPNLKPSFRRLVAGHEGSAWVVREGAGMYLQNCGGGAERDPCWRSAQIVDVFGSDGRYMGEVDIPEGVSLSLMSYIRRDVIVARSQDEAGTIMVKRYRLVLPAER